MRLTESGDGDVGLQWIRLRGNQEGRQPKDSVRSARSELGRSPQSRKGSRHLKKLILQVLGVVVFVFGVVQQKAVVAVQLKVEVVQVLVLVSEKLILEL